MADTDMPVIPEMMRAIGMASPGGPDVLGIEDVAVPKPGAHDVLIKVAFAGVNSVFQKRFALASPHPGAILLAFCHQIAKRRQLTA